MKYRSLESNQMRVLRNTVNVWDHMSRVTSRCLEQFKWSACDSTVLLSRFFFSTGFGRVFSGSHGIWLKYRAGCGKMWDLLTGYGIWLLQRGSDRDSLKSWGKNGIRERDDRSVGFGFDLTKKWESGISEVTRLSRSIFPRWSKEQVIFLVMRPFPKMFQTKVLLSPQKFISKKCWKLSSLPLKLDHCRNIFVAVVFMSSNWCSLHRSDILVRRPCATGTGQPGKHTYRDCNLLLFLQRHAKKEKGFE